MNKGYSATILICLAFLSSGFLASVRAADVLENVEFDALGDRILETDGLPHAGDTVRLGVFPTNFDFSANQTFSSLDAAFTQVGGTSGMTTTINTGQFSGNAVQTTSGLEGMQLYVWVLNPTNTAWVIVTNTSDPDWKVPADGGFNVIDTSDIGTFVPVGAFGIGVFNNADPAGTNMTDWKMTTMPIPEPSTFGLIGVGALGMLALRRRIKR